MTQKTKQDYQVQIDKHVAKIEELRAKKLTAPTTPLWAKFMRSSPMPGLIAPDGWYGPYIRDTLPETVREVGGLIARYSWAQAMIYDLTEQRVVHVVSDLTRPFLQPFEYQQVAEHLIKVPRHQAGKARRPWVWPPRGSVQ